jgi:hypothetical protein
MKRLRMLRRAKKTVKPASAARNNITVAAGRGTGGVETSECKRAALRRLNAPRPLPGAVED